MGGFHELLEDAAHKLRFLWILRAFLKQGLTAPFLVFPDPC